jgi:hypothetical protein
MAISAKKTPARKKRGARMLSVVTASRHLGSSVNPAAALEGVLTRLVGGKIAIVAREGFYRKSDGSLQALDKPLAIDARIWKRIEDGHQREAFWSNGSVQLASNGNSPALHLSDIVVEQQGLNAILASVRRAGSNSMAGAQTCRHAQAIDFLIRYLRDLRRTDEARFQTLKQTTVQDMLAKCYKSVGGRMLGARGLKDISSEIHRLTREDRVDEKLAAELGSIAGISARDR